MLAAVAHQDHSRRGPRRGGCAPIQLLETLVDAIVGH
jgi:hypothetical protein